MPESATLPSWAARSRVDLGEITPHNVRLLRKINASVFPVVYHDKFYKDVLEAGELAKLVYYNDVVVGAVCCRVDPPVEGQHGKKLYIMTLGCLAPYRRLGVGTKMLEHVMDVADKEGGVEAIFLHVQGESTSATERALFRLSLSFVANNEGALAFYRRHGFQIVATNEEYYKRIKPAEAHVLEKRLDEKAASTATSAAVANVNGDARED